MLAMRSGCSGSIRTGCCVPAFGPKDRLPELRAYVRQRERLLEYAASHIQHMQKALTEMNLQLHHVVADITGSTGLRIIRAILAATSATLEVLACLRHYSCHSSAGDDREGTHRELPHRASVCARAGNSPSTTLTTRRHLPATSRIEAVLKELMVSIAVVMWDRFHRLRGVSTEPIRRTLWLSTSARRYSRCLERTSLGSTALVPYLSLKLIAECGDDLSSWPSAKHFTSWLGLAPSNKISGGKMLLSRTRRSGGRAAALLRLAAVTALDAPTPRSGAFL